MRNESARLRLQHLCGLLRFSAPPPPPSIPSSFSSPFTSSFPFLSPPLLSFPSPLPSPFRSYVRPWVSTPVFVPVPVPILRSFVRLHPGSRSRSVPVPITIYVPVPASDPIPVSVPTPVSDPAPDPVRSFPSLGPGYSLGAMRLYRYRALRTELSSVRKRHPLSSEMMTDVELKCLLVSTAVVGCLALLHASSALPDPVPILFPVPISAISFVCMCVRVCVCDLLNCT